MSVYVDDDDVDADNKVMMMIMMMMFCVTFVYSVHVLVYFHLLVCMQRIDSFDALSDEDQGLINAWLASRDIEGRYAGAKKARILTMMNNGSSLVEALDKLKVKPEK